MKSINHLFNKNLANNSEGEALIIAEAGINHDGSYEKAIELVDIAVKAKADIIKFQTFIPEEVLSKHAISSSYIVNGSKKGENFLELVKRLEIDFRKQSDLFSYCKKKRIEFMSTPFDDRSVDFLCDMGVKAIKIASGDVTNFPLLMKIAKTGLPVILSTGMASYGEIEEAYSFLRKFSVKQLFLMHCVSWYPARIQDMNIRTVGTLQDMFGIPVGLSDHSLGINACLASRALGVKFFEKHFTVSKNDFGPDHHASLEPGELIALVKGIKEVEACMGDGVKKIIPIEYKQRMVHRRSLVAGKNIKSGSIITKNMIKIKRPGTGIQPKHYEDVIGKIVNENIEKDQVLQWSMISNRSKETK